jgi:hypothetical protein
MPDAGGDGKSIRGCILSLRIIRGAVGRAGNAANAYKHASWMNENAADYGL